MCFWQEFLRPVLPAHPLVPSNGGALGRPQHASGVGWVQRRRFGDSRVGSGEGQEWQEVSTWRFRLDVVNLFDFWEF